MTLTDYQHLRIKRPDLRWPGHNRLIEDYGMEWVSKNILERNEEELIALRTAKLLSREVPWEGL